MSLKDDKQQNIQMQLDFSSTLTGEAREVGREGTESAGAMNGTENPASTNRLMEEVCERENLKAALRRVKANKGSPGVDGMTGVGIKDYLKQHWPAISRPAVDGPVRTVVWQGSAGDRRPYADHRGQEGEFQPHSLDGQRDSRGPANMMPRPAASGFACIAWAQLVQFRKWPLPCGARLPPPPCQPRRFVRGTVRSFALLIGSPPYVSWPCLSAELKFSSLTRASIGVNPATYSLLRYSNCRFQPPEPPSPPTTATCFQTRTAGAAISISNPPGFVY